MRFQVPKISQSILPSTLKLPGHLDGGRLHLLSRVAAVDVHVVRRRLRLDERLHQVLLDVLGRLLRCRLREEVEEGEAGRDGRRRRFGGRPYQDNYEVIQVGAHVQLALLSLVVPGEWKLSVWSCGQSTQQTYFKYRVAVAPEKGLLGNAAAVDAKLYGRSLFTWLYVSCRWCTVCYPQLIRVGQPTPFQPLIPTKRRETVCEWAGPLSGRRSSSVPLCVDLRI